MADLLPFPPPVTGERAESTVPVSAYTALMGRHDTMAAVLRQVERERDAALDMLDEHALAIAEGRWATPGMVWARIGFAVLCTALVVWLLARMVP